MLDAADDDGLALHVGRVLRSVWDPVGLGPRGPADEYDAYVPDLIALTRNTAVFEDELVAHLEQIEVEMMRLSLPPAKRTRAARALLGLRDAHLRRAGRLVEQWCSPDGLRCAWVLETPGGLYTYGEGILRHEDDENGPWSRWDDAGQGQSGLFDTTEAAGREAHSVIAWLRESDLAASASVALPWDAIVGWRTPEPQEQAVLDRLLAIDFPGRDGLAEQVRTALVRRIDDEGSLRFQVEGAPAAVTGRVPVEGRYRDGADPGGPGVNLLLHVVGGRLHELEVFKDDGAHILIDPFKVPLCRIAVSTN
ncbi:hypothetical protein ABIE45_006396 [Methylobacterium sp. OAE515]|uniref:DUF6984 family protein n=1 Tax=Methylobacterium sp. OAE515 TaxID=2817895 RepID=UPI0019DD206E